MKHFPVHCPATSFTWFVYSRCSLREARDHFASYIKVPPWVDESDEPLGNFSAETTRRAGMFWFKEKKVSSGLIAHEAVHGVMYMFSKMDLKGPTEETEEFFAYYLQYLVGIIEEGLKK